MLECRFRGILWIGIGSQVCFLSFFCAFFLLPACFRKKAAQARSFLLLRPFSFMFYSYEDSVNRWLRLVRCLGEVLEAMEGSHNVCSPLWLPETGERILSLLRSYHSKDGKGGWQSVDEVNSELRCLLCVTFSYRRNRCPFPFRLDCFVFLV